MFLFLPERINFLTFEADFYQTPLGLSPVSSAIFMVTKMFKSKNKYNKVRYRWV